MTVAYPNWHHGQDYKVLDHPDRSALVFITGNHRLLRVPGDLGKRLRQGLYTMSVEERDEWNKLAEAGIISDVNRHRLATSTFSDGSNLAINVNLTAVCNLGCTYCFADGGDYGRIKGKMGSHTVNYIFDFISEHVTSSQTVRFEFFGGEPLLNFERIKEICDRSDEMHRELGIKFIYRISTNLTSLPPGSLELFAAKSFIVSVSVDGDEETHNRNRPTKGGKGSFTTIMENCLKVRRVSDDITLVARMTVIGDKPPLIDNVRALWHYNIFDYFQIYPGVVPPDKNLIFLDDLKDSRGSNPHKTMSSKFLRQLAELIRSYQEFLAPTNRFRGVLEYERIVDMVANGKLALSYCSGGRNYFTFSPDDSVMPCHRLVGDVKFQVGAGREGLLADLSQWRLPVDDNPICSQCWIRYICGGGCKQENFIATGTLNHPNPETCNYQIEMVEHVLQMMASQDTSYSTRDRAPLDNLFVSCGRPVTVNLRKVDDRVPENLQYFQIV